LLTESLLLGAIAGALGLLVALGGIRVLTLLFADSMSGTALRVTLNWHVLLATLVLSLLCSVLFGLLPAMQATRPELVSALKEAAIVDPRQRLRRWAPAANLRHLLVVAQIAMSVLLLVGAGLFLRTLVKMQSVQLGFSADHVVLFDLNAPQAGYASAQAARFYDEVRQRLAALAGVQGATLSHASLITAGRSLPLFVDGVEASETRVLDTGAAFFSTMRIPILQGREIDDRDRLGSTPTAVVSDLFARTYFGDRNPLGQHVRLDARDLGDVAPPPVDFEVIGVAANARYQGLRGQIPPVVYLSYAQMSFPPLRQMTFAVRTSGEASSFVRTVQDVVSQVDPRIPVTHVRTQTAEIDQAMSQETVLAWLSTIFAALALLIACVGLYATMAYAVARRTGEIGIRMALGARQGTVRWMVLREACALATVGLVIGIPAALGVTRLVRSFLYDVTPADPYALSLALAMLAAATVVAAYGPAHRASRISPMRAVRNE
jgi:predicted permease